MSSRRKAGRARGKTPATRKKPAVARVRATKAPARASAPRKRAADSRGASFPADFTIAQADDVKKQLTRILTQPAPVTLDLSSIRRIDTAGLQVLAAFIRERRAAGRPVECSGASESFTVTAHMLGLGAVFA
jgi:anti-anti-sigma regulatory factor